MKCTVNRKIALFTIIGLILVFIASGIAYSFIGNKVDTGSLQIKEIDAANNKLYIAGTTINSGMAFVGYDYSIVKDSLYLTTRYVLVNPFHKNGDFNITINSNFAEINKIYLQGKDVTDLKLIWSNGSKGK